MGWPGRLKPAGFRRSVCRRRPGPQAGFQPAALRCPGCWRRFVGVTFSGSADLPFGRQGHFAGAGVHVSRGECICARAKSFCLGVGGDLPRHPRIWLMPDICFLESCLATYWWERQTFGNQRDRRLNSFYTIRWSNVVPPPANHEKHRNTFDPVPPLRASVGCPGWRICHGSRHRPPTLERFFRLRRKHADVHVEGRWQ